MRESNETFCRVEPVGIEVQDPYSLTHNDMIDRHR